MIFLLKGNLTNSLIYLCKSTLESKVKPSYVAHFYKLAIYIHNKANQFNDYLDGIITKNSL